MSAERNNTVGGIKGLLRNALVHNIVTLLADPFLVRTAIGWVPTRPDLKSILQTGAACGE